MTACYSCAVVRAATIAVFLFAAAADAAIQIPEGGYLTAEHHDDLVMTPDGITVEGWFYLDEYPAEGRLLVPLIMKPASYYIALVERPEAGRARMVDPGPYVEIHYRDHDSEVFDGRLFCGGYQGRSVRVLPDTNPVPAGKWMHVAFAMRDKGDWPMLVYYLNGIESGRADASWIGQWDTPLYIGGVPASSPCLDEAASSWRGRVDSVRVSRGIRYDAGVFVPERDLQADRDTIAMWTFDRAAATYEDKAGNGHTLSVVGSLLVSPQSKLATTWGTLRLR